jgi:hypothetical protein
VLLLVLHCGHTVHGLPGGRLLGRRQGVARVHATGCCASRGGRRDEPAQARATCLLGTSVLASQHTSGDRLLAEATNAAEDGIVQGGSRRRGCAGSCTTASIRPSLGLLATGRCCRCCHCGTRAGRGDGRLGSHCLCNDSTVRSRLLAASQVVSRQ